MTTVKHNGKLYRVEDEGGEPKLVPIELKVGEQVRIGDVTDDIEGHRIQINGTITSIDPTDRRLPYQFTPDGFTCDDSPWLDRDTIITLLEVPNA